ncbi:alpha/beta hydrolase, partial [Curtobacterium sp. MCLR17_034]|uniref:alpha/beta fold hydrolase n=1 Tax=Curtobacterium sp. MCLR17_034 TaxID=2175623 RepID=UPI0028169631
VMLETPEGLRAAEQILAVPVVVDGTTIATRVLEPAGPARGDVVLCHGTPWSSAVWAEVGRALAQDHRVFLWDMPGYGDSDRGPTVDTTLRAQAIRLGALLDRWGLDRPHLVAHDVGGAVALRAHLLHGAEYASLFLWDAVVLDPWGSPFFRLVAEHRDVFDRLPGDLHAALVRQYIDGASARGFSPADLEALARPWAGPEGQVAFSLQIAALTPDDTRVVAELLGSVRCRTRIGWGRQDPWIPLHQAYDLQTALPGHPEVVVLDDVGHLAPWEDPVAVTAALRQWVHRPVGSE